MTDEDIQRTVGGHAVSIRNIEESIKEIKEAQKVVLEFIAEHRAGRRYVWIFFAAIAGLVAFFRDIVTTIFNVFHIK